MTLWEDAKRQCQWVAELALMLVLPLVLASCLVLVDAALKWLISVAVGPSQLVNIVLVLLDVLFLGCALVIALGGAVVVSGEVVKDTWHQLTRQSGG